MQPVLTHTAWLEAHLLPCPSKALFLIDCPGCGLQRSLLALLNGDFLLSWNIYPPGIFVLLTLLMLSVHLVFGLRNGALLLKILFIITTSIIAINYIHKIINHQLL